MRSGTSLKVLVGQLAHEIRDDDVFNGAAALGFYLTLAIFPTMIFVMALIPYLPIAHVDQAIMDLLRQALPRSAADMFSRVVHEVVSEQRSGLLSFGLVGSLWATSSGMYATMKELNNTYEVEESRGFVKGRLVAIALSVLFIVLILGGFSLIVLGGDIQDFVGARFGFSHALLTFFVFFRWAVIVLSLLLALALIYYLAPDLKQRFALLSPGSVGGVVVLMLASMSFAWYTRNFGRFSASYGSIGAVIVLMLWLYIVGLVILGGAEINAAIERHASAGKARAPVAAKAGVNRPVDPPAAAAPAASDRVAGAAAREAPHAPAAPAAAAAVPGWRTLLFAAVALAAVSALSRTRSGQSTPAPRSDARIDR